MVAGSSRRSRAWAYVFTAAFLWSGGNRQWFARAGRLRPAKPREALCRIFQIMPADTGDAPLAAERHRHIELRGDDRERLRDPGLPERTQAVNIGASQVRRVGAQRQRPEHVLPRADAAVEMHLDPLTHRFHY